MQITLKKVGKTKKKKIKKAKGIKWMEKLDQYLEKLKMEYEDIEVMDKREIKEITKDYDNGKWKEELSKKPTAKIYHMRKRDKKQENIYDNRYSSVLLLRTRESILEVNDGQRHNKVHKDTSCKYLEQIMKI